MLDGFDEEKAHRVERRLHELKAMRTPPVDTRPGAIMRAFVAEAGHAIDQAIQRSEERAYVTEALLRSAPPRSTS